MIRDLNREPLAFYTQHCTCKKHKIDDKGCQSGAPCFCTWRCACKKYKIDDKGRQSGAPCFLYALVR
jgi:hypothetical protein